MDREDRRTEIERLAVAVPHSRRSSSKPTADDLDARKQQGDEAFAMDCGNKCHKHDKLARVFSHDPHRSHDLDLSEGARAARAAHFDGARWRPPRM